MYSRAPYSKMPYSRPYGVVQVFSQLLSATVDSIATLARIPVFTVVLQATVEAFGRRMTRFYYKQLIATAQMSVKVVKAMGINLLATSTASATLSMVKALTRTLSATTEAGAGILKKVILLPMTATTATRVYYLRIFRVFGWLYNGVFSAGKRIVVDRDRLTVTQDGVNVIDQVDGDIPFFEPGDNTLSYTDDEATRDIKLRIQYRGRWM